MTQSNRGAFSSYGDVTLKINSPIWLVFKLDREYLHVHFVCKCQEDPIKTDRVILITK